LGVRKRKGLIKGERGKIQPQEERDPVSRHGEETIKNQGSPRRDPIFLRDSKEGK